MADCGFRRRGRQRYLAVAKSDQRVTRAMIVLRLSEGVTWRVIVTALSTSSATISRVRSSHIESGADNVLAERRGQRADDGGCVGTFLKWVIETCTPKMFGFLGTGWTCDLLSLLLELNLIERLGWHLRDEIPRNHHHPTIDGLIAATLRG